MLAAQYGNASCVRLLIDAGANKEAKDRVRIDRFVALVLLRITDLVLAFIFNLSHFHGSRLP